MSQLAIQIDSISKYYRLGRRERYLALRDVLTNALKAPLRLLQGPGAEPEPEHIWALKNVNLEVKRSEILGIVGRNGAGKSTLLKVLTRITKPTEGRARIWGRVGSLLEVGTGFHPELTGRENIFMSGSILGMRKSEIRSKFDQIVAFAGIEKFLDTPAKHYSSGMYTRLGFAVAAHLEPEVLLVDEVLAVGDIEFQKKCLGKMKEVSHGGRTVVLVSHQMNQIRRLCDKVLWMDNGQVRIIGPTAEVTGAYEAALMSGDTGQRRNEGPKAKARFLSWEIVAPRAQQPHLLTTLGPFTVKFMVEVNEPIRHGVHGIEVNDTDGRLLWGNASFNLNLKPGIHSFVHRMGALPLKPGPYYWRVTLFNEHDRLDCWDGTPELMIGTKPQAHPRDEWAGFLNIPSELTIETDSYVTVSQA
jgi:ABC-type polysaccharide/polyol phosphate transport system ATPase subunit